MAKDYYQFRSGSFRLEPSTYRYMAWHARRYPAFLQSVYEIENKNPLKISNDDVVNKADQEKHLDILESSIDTYVEDPYKDAVREHAWYGVEYADLEEKYFLSTGAMKRAVQKYIWGLAQEYGEDFSKNNS